MSDIIINLNDCSEFTTTVNVINLIDVLKSQLNDCVHQEKLSILNETIVDDDLALILNSLTLYLNDGKKETSLPQPMPDDQSFDKIVQEVWERYIVEKLNLRDEDERVKYAIKMATICDYLCCIILQKFFCAYIGSWMRRSENNEIDLFFRRVDIKIR